MAKAEWGTKHLCPETGKRFYDMGKTPVVSPYSGNEIELDDQKSQMITADREDKSAIVAADVLDDDIVLDDDVIGAEVDLGDDVLEEDEDTVSLDDLADVAVSEDEG